MMAEQRQKSPVLLDSLLQGLIVSAVDAVPVAGLNLDSRHIKPGEIFFALRGRRHDALQFATAAIDNGAVAIVHQSPANDMLTELARQRGVRLVHDPDLDRHLGIIAGRFYGEPSRKLKVIGVTGTDGKTSVSHFIAQSFAGVGPASAQRCGLIGTLGNGFYGALDKATHTTPDAVRVQALLAGFEARQAGYVAMEASSHALDQGRVNGVAFDTAVLTNLGRDHLDYHSDLSAYRAAKQRLFATPELSAGVVNLHDEFGRALLSAYGESYPVSVYGFWDDEAGKVTAADRVLAREPVFDSRGFTANIVVPEGSYDLRCRLLGRFNVLNVLAAIAVLRRFEIPMDEIVAVASRLCSVDGRMQLTHRPGRPAVVVDYAHTPQALTAALQALRAHCAGRLWCVFGCGGDRDAGKRPEMGRIAESYADRVVITDDNPRSEDPAAIAVDILAGMRAPERALLIHDRAEAIEKTIHAAQTEDLVLIAGKGHENTQQIKDELLPFHDQTVVNRVLQDSGSFAR
ncbi:MAG TPA: UDP-N-acetylmuramoyl-L-alanyl-D-glutamate--2,6-diaminopimelate ligase [Gammaproteobacteria bacterium]